MKVHKEGAAQVLYKFLGYSLWITSGGVEEKTNEFRIDGMASGVAQAGADCAGARCSGGAGGWLFIVMWSGSGGMPDLGFGVE
ncbi:hypothetical protein M8C21_009438 [Ambrosia artemisiifolia]|uniref:Uncharacterized protein n=1 Tax=Ambrosia artemisiifolia TaxID=4212 RepID=A0AAD5GFD2_AMBAR|nr:hypothetical protein M8C21_009438 [Ambrosia artemisiifolia]